MAMHRWRGYDHPELHRMINSGPGASASTPQTEYWDSLMRELGDIDHDLNAKLGTLAASWEGAAADQARGALNPLQTWATDAQGGASGMRSSTEYQADMIARARAEMPEPVPVTTPAPSGWSKVAAGAALLTGNAGPAAAVVSQAADHEAQEAAQDAASQKAVDTMESYSSSSEFNRNTLGEFVPPPDVVVATPTPSGGVTTSAAYFGGGGTSGPSGGYGGTTPSYSGAPLPPSGGGGGYTAPSGGGGSFTPVGTGGAATPPAAYTAPTGTPTGTTPSGYVPPTGTPVTPGRPTPGQPVTGPTATPIPGGGGGAVPLPGTSGNPSSGGSRTGGLGARGLPFAPGVDADGTRGNQAFRPGMGMGVAGEAAAGARGGAMGAVPTSGGARGGMGMAGPMAGGAARDEEDNEHGLADYLIETVDVFGDERTVSQPVIGEDPER